MDYLPIFMNVTDSPGLVVGGGQVAARKVELLRRAGMAVRVVAPRLCETLRAERAEGNIEHREREFRTMDLDPCRVVIAATNHRAVNAEVSEAARARNIPVNVVDCPELSTFIVPAVIDRSPLVLALSTGGAAPVLARLLRARLETFLPAAYGRLAALMGGFRAAVKQRFAQSEERRRFWERILEGPIAERVLEGDESGGKQALEEVLEAGAAPDPVGEVALVGIGLGDPDLLTVKALRIMQQADVVVYDRPVSEALMDRVRRDAERVFVGRTADGHALPQESVNELLVRYASEGQRVVRLEGGDPFASGRGAEEIRHLQEAGIFCRVVPGITAALGCAAYCGIPLTHREHAQAVVLVTGHLRNDELDLPWTTLVQPRQTVVAYMDLETLPKLCAGLRDHGLPDDWPAAVVEQGGGPDRQVVAGTLADLPGRTAEAGARSPAVVVVGQVVSLRGHSE
ncbi:siroheme synthase CysG [Thiohalorhabdus methylotrophus]|uniref:Siroheme synthase n=1 Tax=Thiohalorhabdus methylotrophus TaxID=3242694 RepID=A0ABV4TXE5_9GAMM